MKAGTSSPFLRLGPRLALGKEAASNSGDQPVFSQQGDYGREVAEHSNHGWEVGKEWMAWSLGFTSKCLPTCTAQRRDGVGPSHSCLLSQCAFPIVVVSRMPPNKPSYRRTNSTHDSGQPSVHAFFPEPGGYLSPYSSPDRKEVTSVLIVHVM